MALNDNGKFNCDFALLLQGEGGIGKSEFFRNVGMRRPDWGNIVQILICVIKIQRRKQYLHG